MGKAQHMVKTFWGCVSGDQMEEAWPLLHANPWLMTHHRPPKKGVFTYSTPFLQAAINHDNLALIEHGIVHGAPLEDRCSEGCTPLQSLLSSFSLSNGPQWEETNRLVGLMVDAGARGDAIDDEGKPAWAGAFHQPMAIWEKMVQGAFTLDYLDKAGRSAISLTMKHHPEKTAYLVENGANVNLINPKAMEYAPLMMALDSDNEPMADFLLAHGARLDLKDALGRGFLHLCSQDAPAKWLIQHGVPLEDKDRFGRTPLLQALEQGNGVHEVSMALIVAGANLDARDHQTTSVLAREWIESSPDDMPELNHLLRSMKARSAANEALAEIAHMDLSRPRP